MKKEIGMNMLLLLLAVIVIVTLSVGCGEAKKEAPAAATAGVANVGITECYKCHNDYNNPASLMPDPNVPSGPFNDTGGGGLYTEGWVDGRHANFDNSPSYTDFGTDTTCLTCHDQLGDGKTIENFSLETGIGALGTTDRPLVTCESCHGGGGNHFGLGPIPYPRSDSTMCDNCHNANLPSNHLTGNPEIERIGEDYAASGHSRSINTHVYVSGSATDVMARCSRCHTDEGVKRYITIVNGTDDHDTIVTNMTGKSDVADASPVQCRTCHVNAGHGAARLLGQNATALPGGWSDEFKTCTSCHQLLTPNLDPTYNIYTMQDLAYHSPFDKSWTTVVNSYGSVEEIIADTHFDDPTTPQVTPTTDPVAGTGGIEGYIIDPTASHTSGAGNTNNGICRDCHNQHSGDLTINRQWARSAHGGHVLEIKEAAANPYAAAVTDSDAPGWIHYNWKRTGRQACQRCHTATGFRNYANDPTTYNPANNVFVATGGQSELLYCWACHTDNVGGLRNPGAITAPYTGAPYTYDDLNGSNVCMACHTGRESGGSIVASAANFANTSFINSHYLTAGGTIFTVTGYEYTGRDYTSPTFYKHDDIGLTAPNTGTNGPCAGCHMSATESHLFLPVSKNETTGAIIAVTSPVCSMTACHPGGEALAMSPTMLENQKALLAAAMDALKVQLQNINISGVGYYFYTAYPYFFTAQYNPSYTETGSCTENLGVKNWQTGGTSTFTWSGTSCTSATNVAGTAGTGKDNMGAAFNYNLLEHDPGAFAHNRYYAKRLIYDSIDWADNNVLDYSTGATLNALPIGTSYKASAMLYLLVNGTPTGTAAERP